MDNIKSAGHKDEGKVPLHFILAMQGIDQVARVGEFGAKKYTQWNYMGGMPWMKMAGSISRHLTYWIRGEDLDKESGISHLAHLVYDALILLEYSIRHPELDDRYETTSKK